MSLRKKYSRDRAAPPSTKCKQLKPFIICKVLSQFVTLSRSQISVYINKVNEKEDMLATKELSKAICLTRDVCVYFSRELILYGINSECFLTQGSSFLFGKQKFFNRSRDVSGEDLRYPTLLPSPSQKH